MNICSRRFGTDVMRYSLSLSEQEMVKQPIQTQIAWLERLKYLFPELFNNIIKETVGTDTARTDLERELQQL